MTKKHDLPSIFEKLSNQIATDLDSSAAFHHNTEKGNASENVWTNLFNKYLPERYKALSGQVIDSTGGISDQIDVMLVDRFYTPPIFTQNGSVIVPVESIYAIFEAKPSMNADNIRYAKEKVASVRALHRENRPHPQLKASPTLNFRILGGFLSLNSNWSPPLGGSALKALAADNNADNFLDIGCIAKSGIFEGSFESGSFKIIETTKAPALFILKLISKLQDLGTVPMINIEAYIESLDTLREIITLDQFLEK